MSAQPPVQDPEAELSGSMSFLDHLEELRTRILRSLIAVGVTFVICWTFVDRLYLLVSAPIREALGDRQLVFISPTGPFNLYVKVALVGAVFAAAPFILLQVWLFIAPGLYKHERMYAAPFVLSATALGIVGALFGYFIAFPFALEFLIRWGEAGGLQPMIDSLQYFNLFLTIELGLAVIFQIPALIFILTRMGMVTPRFLLTNLKYAVLISFVVAAIITPTADIPNLMIMAGPMILLYIVGVGVAFVFKKRDKA